MKAYSSSIKRIINPLLTSCLLIYMSGSDIYAATPSSTISSSSHSQNWSSAISHKDDSKPSYVPGQLVVKLKTGKTLDDIKQLSARYKVKAQDRVFKNLSSPQENLKRLQRQGNGSQIRRQEALIKRLESRKKRAPRESTAPSLESVYIITFDSKTDIHRAVAEYSANKDVEYAEPNYIFKINMVPDDPYYSSQGSWGQGYDDLWWCKKPETEKAWDQSQGKDTVVAVVDTGIDYNHEDIQPNMWVHDDEISGNGIDDDGNGYVDDNEGWDFIGTNYLSIKEGNDPMDRNGHGTHVAGIIAAVGNNGKGIIGIAPMAKVMAVKGLDDTGYGTMSTLARCIRYATDNGADVINNSWGSSRFYLSRLITDAIKYAYANGCVVVCAAGNDGSRVVQYSPGNDPHVITVAASDQDDKPCAFTNYGMGIDVSAPGYDILSLRANGTDMYGDSTHIVNEKYYRASGTSMASPAVSGVAALIISWNAKRTVGWTTDQIKEAICAGSDTPDTLMEQYTYGNTTSYAVKKYGYGRLNAYKALVDGDPSPFPLTSFDSFMQFQPMRDTIILSGTARAAAPRRHLEFWWDHRALPPDYNVGERDFITNDLYDSVSDGILYTFDTRILTDGQYNAIAYVEDTNTLFQNVQWQAVYIGNSEKEGFPVPVSDNDYRGKRRPIFYDLDGDSSYEILVNTAKGIESFRGDGSVCWSVEPDGINVLEYGPPSVGDIDRDGAPEVVSIALSRYQSLTDYAFQLRIFYSNGVMKKEIPLDVFYVEKNPVILYDVNNDKRLESIIFGWDGFPLVSRVPLMVRIYDSEGKLAKIFTGLEAPDGYIQYIGIPAVGDIDADGNPEILVSAGIQYWPSSETDHYQTAVMAFTTDGILKWRQYLPKTDLYPGGNVLIGDVNNDGRNEVILHVDGGNNRAFMYIIDGCDGHTIVSWPIYSTYDEPPILADIDNDKMPEIVFGSYNEVQAWNGDGSFVPGWESVLLYADQGRSTFMPSSVVVGDVNGDGAQEIVVGSGSSVHILSATGALLEKKSPGWFTRSFVGIADTDGDGQREVCAVSMCLPLYGGFEGIHVWPFKGGGTVDEWPMARHDSQYTSCYGVPVTQNHPPYFDPAPNSLMTVDEGKVSSQLLSAIDIDGDKIQIYSNDLPSFARIEPYASSPGDPHTYYNLILSPSYDDGGTYTATIDVKEINSVPPSGPTCPIAISIIVKNVECLPAAPTALQAATKYPSRICLTWKDNANNEKGFKIQRAVVCSMRTGATDFTQIAAAGADKTSFTDCTTKPETAYRYRISAYNEVGNSAYSNIVSISIPSIPRAPSALRATVAYPRKVILKWHDCSNNENGFMIERAVGIRSGFVRIGSCGKNVTAYTDTSVKPGVTYSYRVYAYNIAGDSKYSNTASRLWKQT